MTALIIAAENYNQLEVVKMLIDKGADVNAVDRVGYYTHVDVLMCISSL